MGKFGRSRNKPSGPDVDGQSNNGFSFNFSPPCLTWLEAFSALQFMLPVSEIRVAGLCIR